ncbi:Snf7-domain-containing protein [Xylaria bambusicola]|uniref:Snf7-domain-containing protein n=1 Tax=Xylaria bambusicola TaxID=326684 RepID=UPI002007286E|nr:Snf7-domain-containing protein [Xylaria bambusicola]KAI0513111.1 Snf7-domain-containing protein [Xylaria bambusicola]
MLGNPSLGTVTDSGPYPSQRHRQTIAEPHEAQQTQPIDTLLYCNHWQLDANTNPSLIRRSHNLSSNMESLKALFVKPDPNAQMRKCNQLIRSNLRKLDRDIAAVKQVEIKTKNLIVAADKRGARDATRRAQAQREARDFARELIRARRTSARLVTSKAQLSSVQMQVNEAFAVRKIEGSIKASVGIMKDVNTLIRLPELAGTMRELSLELLKAGVIEEMVGENLPVDEDAMFEDEEMEADGEVDKVLGEILKGKMEKAGPMPAAAPVASEPLPVEMEDEEDDQEAMMDQMRNRLEALRS